jgi:SAM-dependent methyltransferase
MKYRKNLGELRLNPFAYLHLILAYAGIFPFLDANLRHVQAGARVLNIGAGGRMGEYVRQGVLANHAEFESFDIDPARQPDIVGDLTTHSFEKLYDIVFMCEVLEHIPEPQKALDNLLNGLKPGGLLILSCPFLYPLHDRPHDYYRYTRYGLAHLLRKYQNVDIRERNNWAQALGLLSARLCVEPGLPAKAFSAITVSLAFILQPVFWLLGKLIRTDFMTSGYLVTARKKP